MEWAYIVLSFEVNCVVRVAAVNLSFNENNVFYDISNDTRHN